MSWMDEWYRTMREHNTGKCDKTTCRHCAREKEEKERQDGAITKAKALCIDLKHTNIVKAAAFYNGGSDESFVDYVCYYDENAEVHHDELYYLDKQDQPWKDWSNIMAEIAWGILGHGFGNGDFSVSGTIILDLTERKLYNNKHLVANLGS